MTSTPPTALDILSRVFGYQQFRGAQQQIVEHVTGGGDALVLMPTGGGKSLCYQIPALLRAGTGIVVSPLIALMQDQVDALRQLGVRAAFLNSVAAARRAGQGGASAAGRRARPALRRARAAADRALPGAARSHHRRAVRHRRGALRLAVGARLPPRIRPARPCCTSAGRACRASRSPPPPTPPPATRSSSGSAWPKPSSSSPASTGPTSATASSRRQQPRQQLLEFLRAEHPRRRRHRLLPVAQARWRRPPSS